MQVEIGMRDCLINNDICYYGLKKTLRRKLFCNNVYCVMWGIKKH